MEAGITGHVWPLEEIAGLAKDEAPRKRGPYKKNEFQTEPLPEIIILFDPSVNSQPYKDHDNYSYHPHHVIQNVLQ